MHNQVKMRLSDIIEGLGAVEVVGNLDVVVTDVATDSRKVIPGALFACVKGSRVDGHDYAGEAMSRGATAILAERKVRTGEAVTQVLVGDVRDALAMASSRLFGNPSRELTVIGITGTNGKTTTVYLLGSIIEAWGQPVGMMGTLGHRIGDTVTRDPFTTPEAPAIHRYMRSMLDNGKKYCVMEVSSHAIALGRANHVSFDIVAFTNLTRDHLDFHKGLEDYRRTKMRLFGIDDLHHHFGEDRQAVVNIGDETGRLISEMSPLPCRTFCIDGDADISGEIVDLGWDKTTLKVAYSGGEAMVSTSLRGRSGAENTLTAFAIARVLGVDDEAIAEGIRRIEVVPGRMETISGSGRIAVVDYAHTPDALKRLLEDVKRISSGRVICVFGCGGDRDRGKRPEMGKIAADLADYIIVTSDNPRTEDPSAIIEDILRGIPAGSRHEVIPDRGEAIHRAVGVSNEGDIVVVAGKGHEDYQILGTETVSFDDREVVRKAFGMIANAKS
jgi:UDP-N-acetylmuramoyl-L-alanyl-D-glutamate--2,6-diaminopimelate ligase